MWDSTNKTLWKVKVQAKGESILKLDLSLLQTLRPCGRRGLFDDMVAMVLIQQGGVT